MDPDPCSEADDQQTQQAAGALVSAVQQPEQEPDVSFSCRNDYTVLTRGQFAAGQR
jgi:hypothetical protein